MSTTPTTAPAAPSPGLRERKKDATRRAMADAALRLVADRGYDHVTVADIADQVGVSRRTFSNYFSGKAECLVAVSAGWVDDVLQAVRLAPAEASLMDVLASALERLAVDLPHRWELLHEVCLAEPEVQAMSVALEAELAVDLCAALGAFLGVPADDLQLRLFAGYALFAGGECLRDWFDAGKPDGLTGFQQRIALAFAFIDLTALPGAASRPGTHSGPSAIACPPSARPHVNGEN